MAREFELVDGVAGAVAERFGMTVAKARFVLLRVGDQIARGQPFRAFYFTGRRDGAIVSSRAILDYADRWVEESDRQAVDDFLDSLGDSPQ